MTTGPHKTHPAATAVALTGADQQVATGTLVATARKADGKHETFWFGPNGVHCPDGIYADVTAGTPSGSVFIVQ